MPSKRRYVCLHASKSDAEVVQAHLDEFKKSGDTAALTQWKESRIKELEDRRTQAQTLVKFLNRIDKDRASELVQLKDKHRLNVQQRLLESGWMQQDLDMHPIRRQSWHALVDQPKVLTDRTWTNLEPKLIPLLEANRRDRLEREASERKRMRRDRLELYLKAIKESKGPTIDVSVPRLVIPGSTPNPSSSTASSTIRIKHFDIFPNINDALEWNEMKRLYEDDRTIAEMETLVNAHLPEITRRVNKWISDTHEHLVGFLRQGRAHRYIPSPSLSSSNNSSNLLQNASPNLKILLRADSLFILSNSDSPRSLVYTTLVQNGYSRLSFSTLPLNMTKFETHVEAQRVAQMLLKFIGKPDATFLEMRAVGSVYTCGRCHDHTRCTWEKIVSLPRPCVFVG
ncbi:hypothetical protein FRC12_010814 [Ceratobasidium sp. 428]|nr:hypothetical protein FRC12_010814 [Ceratobasidium sp. 428]